MGADLIDAAHEPADTVQHSADWWANTDRVMDLTFDRHQWHASVRQGMVQPYDVLVVHSCVSIVAGRRYRLSFTSSADRAVTMRVRVQDNQPPAYTESLWEPVPLDTTVRRWSFDFAGKLTTPAGELMFQLGGLPDVELRVSEIRLVTLAD